jgi:hypothetical protein
VTTERIKAVADDYIDKFLTSDLSLVKITDDQYTQMELREALTGRICERQLIKIIAYTFMGGLYLEKI